MGYRNKEASLIEIGDLVVVIYPYMDWEWQRYKIGDLGVVIEIKEFPSYSVARVKLFRTGILETIPLDYIALLGNKNGSGRLDNSD